MTFTSRFNVTFVKECPSTNQMCKNTKTNAHEKAANNVAQKQTFEEHCMIS